MQLIHAAIIARCELANAGCATRRSSFQQLSRVAIQDTTAAATARQQQRSSPNAKFQIRGCLSRNGYRAQTMKSRLECGREPSVPGGCGQKHGQKQFNA